MLVTGVILHMEIRQVRAVDLPSNKIIHLLPFDISRGFSKLQVHLMQLCSPLSPRSEKDSLH